MRNEILRVMRSREGYVSGQELCQKFNVSRTAIWKSIRALQEDGYEIEAVPNKGYRILGYPASRLSTERMGRKIRYFMKIDSTNQYCKRIAEEGAEEGTLVIADEQTAGKGRSGRQWVTPPGKAIAFSLLLRPALPPSRISMVTLVMGLSVCKAVRSLYDLPAGIKWPNDVVTSGKKLCGILTEMSAEMGQVHYVVIGVGINANLMDFPPEIADIATSIALETGRDINRAELCAEVCRQFEEDYRVFERDGNLRSLLLDYNALLLNRGRMVRVLDPRAAYSGMAEGISEEGELLVRRADNSLCQVYAGEVSVRGIYGYV